MSLHEVSARLTAANVPHVLVRATASETTVTAKSGAKFKNIESFAKSIKNEAASKYAKSYHTWVKGGRSGTPPRCDESNFKLLKYIRMVVSQLS